MTTESLKRPLRSLLPRPARTWVSRKRFLTCRPPVGWFRFGSLRRTSPISSAWGHDRGRPINRQYIESFLSDHADDIRGRVLEVADNHYTVRFGGPRVTQSDVLHAAPGNPRATLVGDLAKTEDLPALLASASAQAKAEVYMTPGFGQAQINYIGNDGTWAQKQGWEWEVSEKTPAFHIGFGKDFYSWLSGEVLYHDLGNYSMFAGFGQSDEDYQKSPGVCSKPCPTMWGYGTADIQGISVSVLPSYSIGKSKVFARLGMLRYKADWHESYTGGGIVPTGP